MQTLYLLLKCYRLLVRNLKLHLPIVDSNVYLTKIANRAHVSQKSYRRAVQMLSIIKDNPVSYGKDPNALAVATLYAACLKAKRLAKLKLLSQVTRVL